MKKIIDCLKSFLFSPFIIIIFNKMAVSLGIYIPLNIITILIVGFLKIPGLIVLIIINLLII